MDFFEGGTKMVPLGEKYFEICFDVFFSTKVCRRKVNDHGRGIYSTTHTTFTTKLMKLFFFNQSNTFKKVANGHYTTNTIMDVSMSCLLNVRRGQ